MTNELWAIIASAAVGTLSYLLKSYVGAVRADIQQVAKDLARLEGGIEPLRADLKANTIELTKAQGELKAIWRYIDAPKRGSDASNTN